MQLELSAYEILSLFLVLNDKTRIMDRNSSELISIEDAQTYTFEHQRQNPEAIKSHFVGIDKLNLILKQEGCIGISIYEGLDPETQDKKLILVGVDEEGNSMEIGPVLQHLITCPPMCSKDNSLILK